jgi:WD40 repeat protein
VGDTNAAFDLWDLTDPPEAEPVALKRSEVANCLNAAFDPGGRWLVTNNCFTVAFWPLAGHRMRTLRGNPGGSFDPAFSADGRWLASCPLNKPVLVWPLDPADGALRDLVPPQPCFGIKIDPSGAHLLQGTTGGGAFLYPIRGGPPRPLATGWEGRVSNGTYASAFDPSGRRAAAAPFDMNPALADPKLRVIRVWDLETGRSRTFSLAHLVTEASWWGFLAIRFAPDGSLYTAGQDAVRRFVLPADESGTVSMETLLSAPCSILDLSRDGRHLVVWSNSDRGCSQFQEMLVFDLAAKTSRRITSHGRVRAAAFDPSGRFLVTGDADGAVRVGTVTGEEPHLLLGHTGGVDGVAVSPDGRWIASVGDDALHLWPMPDLTKPPLHTLPHAELLAKLDALTNLRVVPDQASATGWKLDVGPFPGWQDVPTW